MSPETRYILTEVERRTGRKHIAEFVVSACDNVLAHPRDVRGETWVSQVINEAVRLVEATHGAIA